MRGFFIIRLRSIHLLPRDEHHSEVVPRSIPDATGGDFRSVWKGLDLVRATSLRSWAPQREILDVASPRREPSRATEIPDMSAHQVGLGGKVSGDVPSQQRVAPSKVEGFDFGNRRPVHVPLDHTADPMQLKAEIVVADACMPPLTDSCFGRLT
jgi:hypothetical protein